MKRLFVGAAAFALLGYGAAVTLQPRNLTPPAPVEITVAAPVAPVAPVDDVATRAANHIIARHDIEDMVMTEDVYNEEYAAQLKREAQEDTRPAYIVTRERQARTDAEAALAVYDALGY